jgi:hypothetical protein
MQPEAALVLKFSSTNRPIVFSIEDGLTLKRDA